MALSKDLPVVAYATNLAPTQMFTCAKPETVVWLLFFIVLIFWFLPVPAVSGSVPPLLAAQIDLDYVYDQDPGQQKRNLELLVKRVQGLGINTVLLQAFADPDGNGVADALYFPNRFLPVRADLLSTAVQELKQCNVSVYAWMPLLAFRPAEGKEELAVLENISGKARRSCTCYYRLSPFNPVSRNIIAGIYEDLAQTPVLDGILFHDDGILSDYEDASPGALAAYARAGFPDSIACIRQNSKTLRRWSRFKTKALIDFSQILLNIIRKQHPDIRSGRNLYALPILKPESEQWFAQSLPLFLQAYDYTFVMAMPYMEKSNNTRGWLRNLAENALEQTANPASLVFELQTMNWEKKEKISTAELIEQIILLQKKGGVSFAWYPDDFHQNHPDIHLLRQNINKSSLLFR